MDLWRIAKNHALLTLTMIAASGWVCYSVSTKLLRVSFFQGLLTHWLSEVNVVVVASGGLWLATTEWPHLNWSAQHTILLWLGQHNCRGVDNDTVLGLGCVVQRHCRISQLIIMTRLTNIIMLMQLWSNYNANGSEHVQNSSYQSWSAVARMSSAVEVIAEETPFISLDIWQWHIREQKEFGGCWLYETSRDDLGSTAVVDVHIWLIEFSANCF